MMRHLLTPFALIASIALPVSAFAIPPEEAKQYVNKPGIHKVAPAPKQAEVVAKPKLDRRSAYLQEKLNLTDQQLEQLQTIRKESREERQAIQEKFLPEVKRKAMHAELKSAAEQQQQKMNTVLTPEQQERWKALHENRIHHLKKKQNQMKSQQKDIHQHPQKHDSEMNKKREPCMHRS